MAARSTISAHSDTTTFLPALHLGFPLRRTLDLVLDFLPCESILAPSARRPDSFATLWPSGPARICWPSAARPSWFACLPRRFSGERSDPSPVGRPFAMDKNGTKHRHPGGGRRPPGCPGARCRGSAFVLVPGV